MTKPGLLQGILIACLLSALSVPLLMVFSVLRWGIGLQMLIATLAGAYIISLVAQSTSRVGRITLGVISFAVLFGACVVGAAPSIVMLLAVGCIWLVRTLLNHASPLPALLDAILCTFSVGGTLAVWIATGHGWLAVWSFFLLQALSVCIPRRLTRSGTAQASGSAASEKQGKPDNFVRAYRAAEDAIRCLDQQAARS